MSASVTPQALREAASRFATGITVVCCVDSEGVDHAMTASSFVAVSLEPLLVSVCVEQDSRFHAALGRSDGWAVSLLAADDEPAARCASSGARSRVGIETAEDPTHPLLYYRRAFRDAPWESA